MPSVARTRNHSRSPGTVKVAAALVALGLLGAASPAGAVLSMCPGDCNDNGAVTIDELIASVQRAVGGAAREVCVASDADGDGQVRVDELVAAVDAALQGCPPIPVAFDAALETGGQALLLTPSAALRGARTYGLVLTNRIADAVGRRLQASPTFKLLKGTTEADTGGPVALYGADPEASGNPYPDSRLVRGDRTVHVPDHFALRGFQDRPEFATARQVLRGVADQLETVRGFSTTAPIRIALSAAVDLATVTHSPRSSRPPNPHEKGAQAPKVPSPALPVGESSRSFASPRTTKVCPESGQPSGFSKQGEGEGSEESKQLSVLLFERRDGALDLEGVLRAAARAGVPRTAVALAVSFPTQPIEDDLRAIRLLLTARAAVEPFTVILSDPDPDDDLPIGVFGGTAPAYADFLAANPDVSAVAHGLIRSPEFRGADGIFDPGKVSGATPATDVELDFIMTIPAAPPPYRVVILQHGFGGDNGFALALGPDLAREGLAGIAISAVSHGRRGSPVALLSSTPLQARDIFRQTNADQMALVRAIEAGIDLDGDTVRDIDPTGIGYLGQSLGGLLGATFIAVEDSIQAAVLNVAGGRVAFLGDNPAVRPIYAAYFAEQADLAVGTPEFEVFLRRLFELGQQGMDPADGLNYARHWILEPFAGAAPRRVLMQEGIGDTWVNNESTEALAAAGGLPSDVALSDPAGVSALWRFDNPGGHGILSQRADVREQAVLFLASGGTEIADPARLSAPPLNP